jgi:hypothetical protein
MTFEFLSARGWAMSSITLVQLAEIVPDLRVLAITFSQNEYRFRLKTHPAEFGLTAFRAHYSVRGRRFNALRRWAGNSLSQIWAKKRGGSRVL